MIDGRPIESIGLGAVLKRASDGRLAVVVELGKHHFVIAMETDWAAENWATVANVGGHGKEDIELSEIDVDDDAGWFVMHSGTMEYPG
jgi:hypothetical protein